ncbi:MAG: phosphotyrosine protein phosphatase [Candidatus Woesearchaeota archaeon]
MKVLFVCNQGMNRSRTAAELFRDRFETRYAGLYSEHPVSAKDLDWADLIVAMDDEQRRELLKRFPKECLRKRLLSMNVPDIYRFQQPELVLSLRSKAEVLE